MTETKMTSGSVKAAMKAAFVSPAPETQEAISKLIKEIQK